METTNGTLRYVGVLYVDYGNTEYVTPDKYVTSRSCFIRQKSFALNFLKGH